MILAQGLLKMCVEIFSPFLQARVRVCQTEGRYCISLDLNKVDSANVCIFCLWHHFVLPDECWSGYLNVHCSAVADLHFTVYNGPFLMLIDSQIPSRHTELLRQLSRFHFVKMKSTAANAGKLSS